MCKVLENKQHVNIHIYICVARCCIVLIFNYVIFDKIISVLIQFSFLAISIKIGMTWHFLTHR